MDPEEVMSLFDSCWFSLEILKKQQQQSSNCESNPDQQDREIEQETTISRLPSILVRSKSDQLSSLTSFTSDALSPNSVLVSPHLQTILSGTEAEEEGQSGQFVQKKPERIGSMRRRTGRGMTKSLSDLEFQELKGFMDLGFEFSEEDVNSSLVEIIPGLQRLGKKDASQKQEVLGGNFDEAKVSRPYLSEAWEVWDHRKRKNPLMNWRIPALGNEIDIKDSLKLWAHNVASAVR